MSNTTYCAASRRVAVFFVLGTSAFLCAEDTAHQDPSMVVLMPRPMRLLEVWTYHDHSSETALFPAVFLVGDAIDPYFGTQLTVVHKSVFSNEGIQVLVQQGIEENDDRLAFMGPAPSRSRQFELLDVDNDGIEEVFVSGKGGAGGTYIVHVYSLNATGVQRIYNGSSRFPVLAFDGDGDGDIELWNAGMEFRVDDELRLFGPEEYSVYELADGVYSRYRKENADAVESLVRRYVERNTSAVRVFE